MEEYFVKPETILNVDTWSHNCFYSSLKSSEIAKNAKIISVSLKNSVTSMTEDSSSLGTLASMGLTSSLGSHWVTHVAGASPMHQAHARLHT